MVNQIDELKMYFGYNHVVNENIIIRQPTILEIIEFGEQHYWSVVQTLCAIPSDMKYPLWEAGIDYEEISDFEFFILISKNLTKEDTCILLGDLDLSKLEQYVDPENGDVILSDEYGEVVIDKYVYQIIVNCIRKMHGLTPKIEHAVNAFTKKMLIEEDKENLQRMKNKPFTSVLKPLVSSLCNSSGFKYKKNELDEVGIVEFMDSIQRISLIKSSDALLKGCTGGMIDATKIDKKDLNWTRDF